MTAAETQLAQIRALCDRHEGERREPGRTLIPAQQILAILDAAPVTATPPQGIDRIALLRILDEDFGHSEDPAFYGDIADRILALVRPVEGILITPEEAALFAALLRENVRMMMRNDSTGGDHDYIAQRSALAARLEKEN